MAVEGRKKRRVRQAVGDRDRAQIQEILEEKEPNTERHAELRFMLYKFSSGTCMFRIVILHALRGSVTLKP